MRVSRGSKSDPSSYPTVPPTRGNSRIVMAGEARRGGDADGGSASAGVAVARRLCLLMMLATV